jgi:hypothetical protein
VFILYMLKALCLVPSIRKIKEAGVNKKKSNLVRKMSKEKPDSS